MFKTRQGVMEDWRSFLPEAGEKILPLPRFLTGSYFHPLDAQHPSLSCCHYNAALLRKSPPQSTLARAIIIAIDRWISSRSALLFWLRRWRFLGGKRRDDHATCVVLLPRERGRNESTTGVGTTWKRRRRERENTSLAEGRRKGQLTLF